MRLLLSYLLVLLSHAGAVCGLCHPAPMKCTKKLLIFPAPGHMSGLTNQLIMLRAMLIVADLLDRDLFVERISASIGRNGEMVSFCSMIDVEGTNAIFLKNKNIQSKFCTGTHILKKIRADPKNKSLAVTLDKTHAIFHPSDAWSEPYLFLGESPLMLGLSLLYNPGTHAADLRFRFAPIFYNITDALKVTANLDEYNAVHFRVEDDWLDHIFGKYKRDKDDFKSLIYCYLYYYVAFIVSNLDTSMPLLVAIGSNTRYLPFALSYLRLYFPSVIVTPKKGIFRAHGYPEGRELYATIDMILIADSVKFIGHSSSTFSVEIVNNRISAGVDNSLYFKFSIKRWGKFPELITYFDNFTNEVLSLPPSGIEGLLNASAFAGKPWDMKDFHYEAIKRRLPWYNAPLKNSKNILYELYD